MVMMMMICNDLMCTEKLTRSQLSLSHNAKVKTDLPKKNKNSWSHGVSPVGGKNYGGKDL